MKCKPIYLIRWLPLIALFMAGCSVEAQNRILTPEETAVHYVREMKTDDFSVDSNSVLAIQTLTVKDLTLVLIQYSGERLGGGIEMCEVVLETRITALNGWKVKNSAGLCHESPDSTNSIPITVVSSWGNSALLKIGYSTAFGYVRDPQITKVVATWDDGQIQPVEVLESTYFVVREGGYSLKEIEAYNDQNEIVFADRLGETEEEE